MGTSQSTPTDQTPTGPNQGFVHDPFYCPHVSTPTDQTPNRLAQGYLQDPFYYPPLSTPTDQTPNGPLQGYGVFNPPLVRTSDQNRRCSSCDMLEYMQPIEVDYTNLGDGRYLCPDCLPIMLMEPGELKPIIRQVHNFFDDYLKVSIRKDIPIFLIDGNEMNRNVIGAINGTPIARGKFLKRGEDTIKAVERCEWSGANLEVVTSTKKVKGDKVGAISLLFGLPRDCVASTLVHEMMHAWIKHQGWTLEKGVEEGLCEAASYEWLKYTASDYDPSYTQKDAEIAKPLATYIKHGMKEDSFSFSAAENWKAKCTIEKYGLKRILKYVACTRNIPEPYDLCSDPSYTQKDAKIAEPLATYIKHGKKEDSFSFSATEFRKAKCTIEQYGFKRTMKYVACTRNIPNEFRKAKCTIEQYSFKRTLKYVASTRNIPETYDLCSDCELCSTDTNTDSDTDSDTESF